MKKIIFYAVLLGIILAISILFPFYKKSYNLIFIENLSIFLSVVMIDSVLFYKSSLTKKRVGFMLILVVIIVLGAETIMGAFMAI